MSFPSVLEGKGAKMGECHFGQAPFFEEKGGLRGGGPGEERPRNTEGPLRVRTKAPSIGPSQI